MRTVTSTSLPILPSHSNATAELFYFSTYSRATRTPCPCLIHNQLDRWVALSQPHRSCVQKNRPFTRGTP